MARRRRSLRWQLELHLHRHFGIQLGADFSIILEDEKVFVLRPDFWRNTLWGQIEYVDIFGECGEENRRKEIVGKMLHDERVFNVKNVISAVRGPALQAVRRLQRLFRKKRYFHLDRESGGWDAFVQVVVAFAQCRGRVLRKRKVESVCPGPSWGYVPETEILNWGPWAGICVQSLQMQRQRHQRLEKRLRELRELRRIGPA